MEQQQLLEQFFVECYLKVMSQEVSRRGEEDGLKEFAPGEEEMIRGIIRLFESGQVSDVEGISKWAENVARAWEAFRSMGEHGIEALKRGMWGGDLSKPTSGPGQSLGG